MKGSPLSTLTAPGITYNKGTQQELDINFLILHDGRELRGMLQNAGTAVQCDLIRMGAPDDHVHQ